MPGKGGRVKDVVPGFSRQQRENNYSMYRLAVIIGSFVICGLLLIIVTQYLKEMRTREELAEYQSRIREQEARLLEMKLELDRLQDLDYIEGLARSRLGLVKPGEIIIQIED